MNSLCDNTGSIFDFSVIDKYVVVYITGSKSIQINNNEMPVISN